ncbi:hypothetical protein JCM1841_004098 [Sporobolomyces salmonicolor]
MAPSSHLILLRAPSTEPDQDPYALALSSSPGWTLHHLPILDTGFVNLPQLAQAIQHVHAARHYAGVIMTSARSAEAWSLARGLLPAEPPACSSLPFFVVGLNTRTALLRSPSPPAPSSVHGASTTGTGDLLARYILSHRPLLPTPSLNRPLLYLTGDKNRDTLPRLLKEGGVETRPLQVYETTKRDGFDEALEARLRSIREQADPGGRIWIALFSPSGAEASLASLRRLGLLPAPPSPASPGAEASDHSFPSVAPRVRLAAIGPTTRDYLVHEVGVAVHAVARRPEAGELVGAVLAADQREKGETVDGAEGEEG